MILHVLFAQFENESQPKAVTVVDSQSIAESTYTEDEYLAVAAEQAVEMFKEKPIKEWSWYNLYMDTVSRSRIAGDLMNIKPSLSAQKIEARPKPQNVSGVPGITVTVGRTPGKIIDDEIFGE